MNDTEHIPIDRMQKVLAVCDYFLTEPEQEHIQTCEECLKLFGRLVMTPDWENLRDLAQTDIPKTTVAVSPDDAPHQLHTVGLAKTGTAATGSAPFEAVSGSRRYRA